MRGEKSLREKRTGGSLDHNETVNEGGPALEEGPRSEDYERQQGDRAKPGCHRSDYHPINTANRQHTGVPPPTGILSLVVLRCKHKFKAKAKVK